MGIEIEMTGSGELGPIAPGWSIQEYATPATIGDTAGGTGNVSFSAASTDTSLFVVNNRITTTLDNIGHVSGVIKTVSESGLNTSISHDTPLSIFDATKNIPALGSGSIYSALDLCTQLSGREKYLAIPEGHFYSLAGHSSGFDFEGNLVTPVVNEIEYETYYYWAGSGFYPEYYREQYGSIWATTFTSINNETYATRVYGDCFKNGNDKDSRSSRIAFKTLPNGSNVVFRTDGGPSNLSANLFSTSGYFTLNPVAKTLVVSGRYYNGVAYTVVSSSPASLTALDMNSELAVFLQYDISSAVFPAFPTHTVTVTVCNVSDYSTTVTATVSFDATPSVYNEPWNIVGNVRALYRNQSEDMLTNWIGEYENEKTFVVENNNVVGPPVAAVADTNMWEYLQQACSAYEYEITCVNDIVVASGLANRVIDITNKTVPTISPNVTLGGRSIDVTYSNAQAVANTVLYDARQDNNRVISVDVNATTTVTVPIAGTPTIVNLPYRGENPVNAAGEYTITQANGTQVPQEAWANYGGRVKVFISTTAVNALDIVVTGPSGTDGVFGGTTPVYTGPFKLAYSSGTNEYAALSVIGTGIKTNIETLTLDTGADRTKTFQESAKTINNIFINTKEQAYDRGIWAASDISGPRVTMSASIPISQIDSLGYTAGSRIWYRDSIYRITDVTIGNLVVSFNAVRHVTADDFDTLWSGSTVGTHDLTWTGFDASDHKIAPLRFIGDNESVLMFLDEDVVPYYDFTGEPEISVFPDTDINPYYEDGGNLDGEEPVYLDSDDNPYV